MACSLSPPAGVRSEPHSHSLTPLLLFPAAQCAPSTPPQVRVTTGKLSSGSIIPRPEVLRQRRKPRNTTAGPADTAEADAAEVTHTPGDLPSFLKQQLAAAASGQSATTGAQQRQYSTAAAAAVACGSLLCGRGSVLGGTPRLLGGSMRSGQWRGFAAGAVW